MTVQSVIREVCSFVGVRSPQGSVFLSPFVDRTAWEFVQLANEMAQRIAYDTRDWQALRKRCQFFGTDQNPDPNVVDLKPSFALPADYHRMLLTAQVWRSSNTSAPMSFISDPDEWLRRELQGSTPPIGEWIIENEEMQIRPGLTAPVPAVPPDPLAVPPVVGSAAVPAETATFYYMRNTPVRLTSGGFGKEFLNDADTFVLPERLLKLAMIWQWKCNKGATYAEDLANYEDALHRVAGADKPSPIMIGSQPISSEANIAYYGQTPPGSTFVGPGP